MRSNLSRRVVWLQLHLNASRRETQGCHTQWPEGPDAPIGKGKSYAKDCTLRGIWMPAEHLRFFHELAGKEAWYRAPNPLATSFSRETAQLFMGMGPVSRFLFVGLF